jgi:hypothetical protein
MTYAPARLLDLRHYLQPLTGLRDYELGIVGDENHLGGYHHGWDDRRIVDGVTSDYSWNESTRDSSHKTNAASAFDIGMFARLRELSVWLVGQCAAGAPDTVDIREVIYSPDGQTVKRWDRLGRRASGDSSHLTHTHISFFRDAESRDKTAVFKRFFGDDMNLSDLVPQAASPDNKERNVGDVFGDVWWGVHVGLTKFIVETRATLAAIAAKVDLEPAELEQIKAAAEAGAHSGVLGSLDELVAAFVSALPDDVASREDVKSALREVLLTGVAPIATQ